MGRRDSFGADFDIKTSADTSGLDNAQDGLDKLDDKVKGSGNTAEQAGEQAEKAEGGFSKLAKSALGMFAGLAAFDVAGNVVDFLKDGAAQALAWDGAMRDFQAQTGASAQELAQYKAIGQEVFNGGWGEDVNAVVEAMSQARQITGLTGDALEGVTENALALNQAFGLDVKESVTAANAAMTQFGLNSTQAFDLITYTMQKTGDPAGDLLSTITEFGPNFEALGFTADQMFQVLNQGSAAGIASFSKIGDGVKEFGIRVKEGGDEVTAVFDDIFKAGEDWTFASNFDSDVQVTIDSTKDLFKALQDGSIDIADISDQVSEYLLSIDDPIERNRMGVALLGSYYEDFGDSILTAMDTTATGIDDANGSTNRLKDSLQNGLGPAWNRVKRQALTFLGNALTPIGLKVVNFITPVLNDLADFMAGKGADSFVKVAEKAQDFIDFLEQVGKAIVDALGGKEAIFDRLADGGELLADALAYVWDIISNLSPETITALGIGLAVMTGPAIIAGLIAGAAALAAMAISAVAAAAPFALLAGLVIAYEKDFGGLKTSIKEFGDAVKDKDVPKAAGALGKSLAAIPYGIAKEAGKLLGIDVEGGLRSWGDNFKLIGLIWQGLKERMGAIGQDIKSGLTDTFNGVGDTISQAVDTISGGAQDAWNSVTDFFEGAGDAINSAIDSASVSIGNSVGGLIEGVSQGFDNAKGTVTDIVKGLFSEAFGAAAAFVSDPGGSLISAVNGLPGLVTDSLAGLDSILGTDLSGAFETATTKAAAFFNDPAGTLLTAATGLSGLVSNALAGLDSILGTDLSGAFQSATQDISDLLGDGSSVLAYIQTFPNLVGNYLATLPDKLLTFLQTPFSTATGVVTGLFGLGAQLLLGIFNLPDNVVNGLSDLATTLTSNLETPFNTALNLVTGLLGSGVGMLAAVGLIPENVASGLTDLLNTLTTNLKTPFENTLSGITGFIDDLLADIGGIPGSIVSKLSGLPGDLTSALIQPFRDAAETLGNIELLPGVSASDVIGLIPGLAEGGFSQGGIYKVGERGQENVAIPPGGYVFSNNEIFRMSHPTFDNSTPGNGGGGGYGSNTPVVMYNPSFYGVTDIVKLFDLLEAERKKRAR